MNIPAFSFLIHISRDREMVSRKAHNLKNLVRFQVPQQEKIETSRIKYWMFLFLRNLVDEVGTKIRKYNRYIYIPNFTNKTFP